MEVTRLLILSLAGGFLLSGILASPEEERLLKHMLADYNREIRPSESHNSTVKMTISFILLKISDLDEKTETLRSFGWLNLRWTDSRLQYSPSEFHGIQSFALYSKNIWKPDIVLYNGAELSLPEFVHAIVSPEGSVTYIAPVSLNTFCSVDATRDEQDCAITFGSWSFSDAQIDLVSQDGLDMDNYAESKQLEVVSSSAAVDTKKYSCCSEGYQTFVIRLKLRRNAKDVPERLVAEDVTEGHVTEDASEGSVIGGVPQGQAIGDAPQGQATGRFFEDVLIVPLVILTITSLLMFLLPPESKEKITLGAVIMLCLITMTAVLDHHLPVNSGSMPKIGVYYIFCLFIVFCEIIVQVVTLAVSNCTAPMPHNLRKVFLKGCGTVLCVTSKARADGNEAISLVHDGAGERLHQETDIVQRLITLLLENNKVKDGRRVVQQDWTDLARVLDRICFVLLSLTFIVGSAVILTR